MPERLTAPPNQLDLGLNPPGDAPQLSDELRKRLETTSPMDMLPPEEKKRLHDFLEESYRARIQSEDDARSYTLS